MRISNKHPNVQRVEYSDFRGGLNTSAAPELIAPNELVKAINVEIDGASHSLKTVAGTDTVFERNDSPQFNYLMYDPISNVLLITDAERKVYSIKPDGTDFREVGTLSGGETVEHTQWEDGLLIASGGRLQYFHNGELETIEDEGSPTTCHAPFVKDGRIYLAIGDELHCSAVGDEHGWVTNTNDESSAQWIQVGYKDGGVITGVSSLTSDIIVFKSNHRAYHLAGQFPDWQLSEIGRQIECKGFNSCVALKDQLLTLGRTAVQTIVPTDRYGDMEAANISQKVQNDISQLGAVKLRYMPACNQVWLIDGLERFMFVDMNNGGFFMREYHKPIVDAVEVNGKVYVLKQNKLCVLNPRHMNDEKEQLRWKMQGKTITTPKELLVKTASVDTTPMFDTPIESIYRVDKVTLFGSIPKWARHIYHDYRIVFHNRQSLNSPAENIIFTNHDEVYANGDFIHDNETPLRIHRIYRSQVRQVSRNRAVKVSGSGMGGSLLINNIAFEVTEV